MNKNIKIYSILLSIVYVCLVVFHIANAIDPFMVGFRDGMNDANENRGYIGTSVFHVEVAPKAGVYTFASPIAIDNQMSIPVELQQVKVRVPLDSVVLPSGYAFFTGLRAFLALVLLGVLLYIPFLFFSTSYMVNKGQIYDAKVLRRLKRLGWIVVGYFFLTASLDFVQTYFDKQLVAITNYDVIYATPDFVILLLGLVIVFLSEVLKMSLFMKEEQDLTI